ncbi:hypothetical protein V1477_018361 [Vespula maculifrons]|uniref:Uncharacterized protein n=2 Tax=Vespula TaxID=7451 RepID=A0A834KTF5_VESVU|nr:hypothetical protein HZH66_001449 [Vespula vulgaris]
MIEKSVLTSCQTVAVLLCGILPKVGSYTDARKKDPAASIADSRLAHNLRDGKRIINFHRDDIKISFPLETEIVSFTVVKAKGKNEKGSKA